MTKQFFLLVQIADEGKGSCQMHCKDGVETTVQHTMFGLLSFVPSCFASGVKQFVWLQFQRCFS